MYVDEKVIRDFDAKIPSLFFAIYKSMSRRTIYKSMHFMVDKSISIT
jgi:hypothetical protein